MALKHELKFNGDYLFKHRSYLPIIIIVLGIVVFIQNKITYGGNDQSPYYELIFIGTSVFGLIIRMLAIGYSADNTSGRNTTEGQVADTINTTGLYAICRHPLYVGNFFMWLGIAMFTQNVWFIVAFIFMYWLYYERIMFAEEDFLIEKYGDQYNDWAKNTPAFFPKFKNWKKPKNSFSWKKVIRQEKAGILNLFIVIFIFKSIGQYISYHQIINVKSYWFAGLLFGLLWYICIKTIQKTTPYLTIDRDR